MMPATKKIFIVDDDAFMRMLLEDHISKNATFSISTYSTGEACLDHVHLNPDAWILDFHLDSEAEGALNGIDVIEHIREINRKVPIVLLTSAEFNPMDQGNLSLNNITYIAKGTSAFYKIDEILNEL